MLPTKETADKIQARSRAKDPVLARTTKVRCGEYRVQGEGGEYTVTVSVTGYACDCPAGRNGRACWHCASVYRHRLVDKMLRAATVAPKPEAAEARHRHIDLWDECPDCGQWGNAHYSACPAVRLAVAS